MESWYTIGDDYIDTPEKLKNFYNAIEAICIEYRMTISHVDCHGAFLIEEFKDTNIEWLREATARLSTLHLNLVWRHFEKLTNFVNKIEKVCKEYNLSISHQDNQGAFLIEFLDYTPKSGVNLKEKMEWLRDANIEFKLSDEDLQQ